MKCLLPLLLLAASTALAQEQPSTYDFSKIDPRKTSVAKIDSVSKSIWRENYIRLGLDSLNQLKAYLSAKTFSPKYYALVAGYIHSAASLEYLNSGLRALGFPEMPQNFGSISIGVDVRGKKMLFAYQLSPGIANRVSDANYTIEVRGTQLEFLFGYDLLNSKRVHFYPVVALAVQNFSLSSFRNAASSDVITINDFVLSPSGTTLSQTSWAFTYGAELDFRITNPAAKLGLMLGFRYGRTQTFVEGDFKVDNHSSLFNSPDRLYGSFLSGVLKVYYRR